MAMKNASEQEPIASSEQLRTYLAGLTLDTPTTLFSEELVRYLEGRSTPPIGYLMAVPLAAVDSKRSNQATTNSEWPSTEALCEEGYQWGQKAFGEDFARILGELVKRRRIKRDRLRSTGE